jgi:cbb3-type cytochrome oxidase subunit 3
VHRTLAIQTVQASRSPGGPDSHIAGIVALVLLLLLVIAGVASIVSPRWRRRAPRAIGLAIGGLVAAYLVGRGIAEFWLVDYASPASYRHAWGGPTLAGVFAVHSGPGLIILIAMAWWLYRWRRHASTG